MTAETGSSAQSKKTLKLKSFLSTIRASKKITFVKAVVFTLLITSTGLITGILIKLIEIYPRELTDSALFGSILVNLGDIFSEISVWIFICTVVAVYSSSPVRAGINVFCFCVGMLIAYYITAELINAPYSLMFVYGWGIFALFTPVFAFVTWYAKGKGTAALCISIIIISLMLAVTAIYGMRLHDIIIDLLTAAVLFIKKKSLYRSDLSIK